MLLWTTSWVLRSFIAAVVLLGFVFLRYNCLFNLLVVWKMVVSSGTEVLSLHKVLTFLKPGTLVWSSET